MKLAVRMMAPSRWPSPRCARVAARRREPEIVAHDRDETDFGGDGEARERQRLSLRGPAAPYARISAIFSNSATSSQSSPGANTKRVKKNPMLRL